MNYQSIPAEMKQTKQWVCWNEDKIPRNPYTGGNAQSNNPETWSDFATASEAVRKFNFKGVGFMFCDETPYFGVDLDHCINQNKQDFIDEWVYGLRSYTEISQSGEGLHIICKGTPPQGRCRNDKARVEVYSRMRYFAMTGNIYDPACVTVADCTEQIKPLFDKYLAESSKPIPVKAYVKLTMSDEDILAKARASRSGSTFQKLYMGDWQGDYTSQSDADSALCFHLAFWTQKDQNQMDRLFRNSGLMRPKWDERRGAMTYGEMTISKAIVYCSNVYEPRAGQDDSKISVIYNSETNTAKAILPEKVYEMTDTGNAARLRDKFDGYLHYSYKAKMWYFWNGKYWQEDFVGMSKQCTDRIVEDLKKEAFASQDKDDMEAKLKFATRSGSSKAKENMLKEAQHLPGMPILPEDLNSDPMLLNCQNGVIKLENGELIAHNPTLLMSKCIATDYDPDAKPPKTWLRFLSEVTNGDAELMRYLQKCVGYSLTADTKEQCAFFLFGMGRNGKSVFVDTIADLLATYGTNAQADTIMQKQTNSSGASSDVARLAGARFVTAPEPSEGARLNEGLLKQMTGSDKITARFLYGSEFEFTPTYKIWVCTNHKPIIRGSDFGIWRRIVLIPFTYYVPENKVDKNLPAKLRAEFPQILKWAIDGCLMWQKEGLDPRPAVVVDATKEYKNEMDILATFMGECFEIDNDPRHYIPASTAYAMYREWAKAGGETYIMPSRKFGIEIQAKVPDKRRLSNGIVYGGMKVTEFGSNFRRIGGRKDEDFLE